jgi:5'-3' exonuclease
MHTSPEEALKFLWVQVLMGDSTDNIVGIPGVGIKTAENWLKDRSKDFESFAIRKYVEKFGMVEGITEFFKNFNLVYLLKTDEDLARYGVELPPLQCIDISQDELDIWKDDE